LLGHLAQSIRQRKSPWIECSTVPSVSTGVLDVHALYAERKIRRRAAWPSPSVFPWPEAENRSIDSPSAVVGSEQRHSLLVDSLPTEAPRPPSGLLDPLSRQNPTHNATWSSISGFESLGGNQLILIVLLAICSGPVLVIAAIFVAIESWKWSKTICAGPCATWKSDLHECGISEWRRSQ
jgi:hypothetical protein